MNNQRIIDINNSLYKVYLTCAGGGQSFFTKFMSVSGGSNTIIGGNIPYSRESLIDFCNQHIDKFTDEDTTRLIAIRSFLTGLKYTNVESSNILGIGVTATLHVDNQRANRTNQAWIVIHSYNFTIIINLEFYNNDRISQENILSEKIISTIYDIVHNQSLVSYINDDYKCTVESIYKRQFGIRSVNNNDKLVIFPGSWNPFHHGHQRIVDLAKDITHSNVYLELTIDNTDKGMFDYKEVYRRTHLVKYPMFVTHHPTFVQKAQYFSTYNKPIVFIVGEDTWQRILNPVYAGDINYLYNIFNEYQVQFIVFPRKGIVRQPSKLDELIINDPRLDDFNEDISSTTIRSAM